MDILNFIENGTTRPNPEYKKGSKKSLAAIPVLQSDDINDVKDPTDAIARNIVGSTYGLTYLNDDAKRFSKENVQINPINTEEELEYERGKNQSAFRQFGNMFGQALINEVGIGTIRGFSDIFDAGINLFKTGENDYTNPVSQQLEEWQDYIKEQVLPIYQKDNSEGFHFNDFGWWMNGAVSSATTVSLMLPGLGITKGISALGKIGNIGGKMGKIARKGVRLVTSGKNTGRIYHTLTGGVETLGNAFLMRTAENYQEAREAYKTIYDKSLAELNAMSVEQKAEFYRRNFNGREMSDEDAARYVANVGAGEVFKNDYWMLLMDIPQVKALTPIWKGAGIANKATTRAVRKANNEAIKRLTGRAVAEEAGEVVGRKVTASSILEKIGQAGKNLWTSTEGLMLGEGIEEGFQGIQSARGEETGNMFFNPNMTRRTLGDYLKDESIWEQAFWGVMGGLLFQGAASGFRRMGDRIHAKMASDKLTDEQIAALKAGENKGRVEEIYSRFKLMDDFNDKMRLINNGFNPFNPILDENGQIKLDDQNNRQFERIENVEEGERLKSAALNDFITDLTLNATDNGNYELLKEFVSNPEFSEYFKDSGVDTDALLEKQVLDKMEEVHNTYEKTYYDIIDNVDAYNDWITRAAARDIVRKRLQIDAIDERIGQLDDLIDEQNLSDVNHYYNIAKQRMINEKIKAIDKAIASHERKYKRDNFYSKQAYENNINELNKQKRSLLEELSNDNPTFNFDEFKVLDSKGNEIIEETLKAAQEYYDDFVKNNIGTLTSFDKLSDTVQENLYKKANYELYRKDLENELPQSDNTKDYYKKLYDDIEAGFVGIAESKFTDAYNKVYNYIKKQENPVDAARNLLKNGAYDIEGISNREASALQNALDILQFGSYDRQVYNNMFVLMVTGEVANRNKTANQEPKTDGSNGNTTRTNEKLNEELEEGKNSPTGVVRQTPTNPASSPAPSTTSTPATPRQTAQVEDTSTGPVEEIVPGEIEIDIGGVIDEEGVEILTPEEEKLLENMASSAEQNLIFQEADDLPIVSAQDAAIQVKLQNPGLFQEVVSGGYNSKAYQEYLDLVKENMIIEQGNSAPVAEKYAETGIKLMLDIALNANKTMKFENYDAKKVKDLFNSISKAIGINPETMESSYLGFDATQAKTEKGKNVKDIFDKYVDLLGLRKSVVGGRYVIDIKRLYKELANLFEEQGMTYNMILSLYRDMGTFVESYQGNEYLFTNKDFLNKKIEDFIDGLYKAKTEIVTVSPFMHFRSTIEKLDKEGLPTNHTLDGLSSAEIVKLINKAKRDGVEIRKTYAADGKDVSIAFGITEGGKWYELGMLAPVKTINEDGTNGTNETLIGSAGNGKNIRITKNSDGSITSDYDNVINEILNNDDLYRTIAEAYIRFNAHQFDSKYLLGHTHAIPIKDKIDFLKNPIIEDFAKAKGIQYYIIDKNSEPREINKLFEQVYNIIGKVLFYSINNKTTSSDVRIEVIENQYGLRDSYLNFKDKQFDNFKNTADLMGRLNELEDRTQRKDVFIKAKLMADDTGRFNYWDDKGPRDANRIGVKSRIKEHPYVYFDGVNFVDEHGKVYKGIPGLYVGTVGLVMGVNQGDTMLVANDEEQRISGINIGVISGSNTVQSSSTGLVKATQKHLTDAIEQYYSIIKSDVPLNQKERAFRNLYNTFNNLFGNTEGKPFTGYYITTNNDSFAIYRNNADGTRERIATFFKYNNLNRDKKSGVYRDAKTGKIVPANEIGPYFLGGFYLTIGDTKLRQYNYKSEKQKKNVESLVNAMTTTMTYNQTRLPIPVNGRVRQSSEHIKIDEKGKIYYQVGDYRTKEYDTFAEMIIDLNMYQVNVASSRYDNRMSYTDSQGNYRLPNSFYLDISQEVIPVDEQQRESDKGIAGWIASNEISTNEEVKTNDLIDAIPDDEINVRIKNEIKDINKKLADSKFAPLFTDKVRVNANIPAYGRYVKKTTKTYNKGDILIGKKAIKFFSINGNAGELVRVLIHENVHRLVDENNFFDKELGQERIKQLNDIFKTFYDYLLNDTKSEKGLVDTLKNTFGDLYEKWKDNPQVLAEEFLAEAISDGALRNYLNEITTEETIVINNKEQKKTLLQKILEIISELFNFGHKINNNSLLAKLHETLGDNIERGDNVIETTQTENEVDVDIKTSPVKEIDTQSQTAAEENYNIDTAQSDETKNPAEFDETSIQVEDDNTTPDGFFDIDFNVAFSRYEGYESTRNLLDAYNSDKTDNPMGYMAAPDMQDFIRRFPVNERAEIQSELNENRLKYACRI